MVDPVGIDIIVIYLSTGHNRKGKREAKVVKVNSRQEDEIPSEGISFGSKFPSEETMAISRSSGKTTKFLRKGI